ncbi:MAG TPA: DinB family protein [Bryobacteraceae bacterium]|nr:DinB family protein [Bryobacteraceae bacterium]
MTSDQAEFLLNAIYLPEVQNERNATRRVIQAIPADKCDWKPDSKSKSALDLAWHLASSECFFLNGVATGAFDPGSGERPDAIKTPADILKWYDENAPKATAAIASLKGDALTRVLDFHGVFSFPAIAYLGLMTNHSIHHRGQLSTYLRPMGSKVPSIYGGSADEPFEMPNAAKA